MDNVYTLKSSHIQDMETFYDEIATVLLLPDHFGRNLDALYDCLSDHEGDTIILAGFDAIEEKLGQHLLDIMEVFSGAGIEVVLEYGF